MGLLPLVELPDAVDGQDGSLLVVAMGGADGHGQGADAGALYEPGSVLHLGVVGADAVGGLAHQAQLTFHGDAHFGGHFHNTLRNLDVFLDRLTGCVDHHAGGAVAEGAEYLGDAGAVVQMERHGGFHIVHGFPDDGSHILGKLGIEQAAVHLEDHRRAGFLRGLHNAQNGFQVVNIERGDGKAAGFAKVKNLFQTITHDFIPPDYTVSKWRLGTYLQNSLICPVQEPSISEK